MKNLIVEGGYRGLAFASWKPRAYATAQAADALAQLAATGATDVAIVTTAYLRHDSDSEVAVWDHRTPTHDALRAALRVARRLGLRTALKPQVDLVGGGYRGAIAPNDPDRWFASYRDFLLPLAEVATDEGCASFWIGTELDSMTRYLDHWREVIEATRALFAGPLVYCANWTDLESDETFELGQIVDIFGVDAYFPVAEDPDASVGEMIDAWGRWTPFLEAAAHATGRPLLVTELGCTSQRGAAVEPWDYAERASVDLEVQARYYEAALRALTDCPAVAGLCFWAWGIGPAGPTDRSHSPRNKPAEAVLRRFWGGEPLASPPPDRI
jgi:hypothetical protein